MQESALEDSLFSLSGAVSEMNELFTYEPLYSLWLEISKMLKECVVSYYSPRIVLTNERGAARERKLLLRVRKAVLGAYNTLPSEIEDNRGSAILKVNSSKGGTSSERNGLCKNMGLRVMLEAQDQHLSDLQISIVAGLIDRSTVSTEGAPSTKLHTTYLDLIRYSTNYRAKEHRNGPGLSKLGEGIRQIKEVM